MPRIVSSIAIQILGVACSNRRRSPSFTFRALPVCKQFHDHFTADGERVGELGARERDTEVRFLHRGGENRVARGLTRRAIRTTMPEPPAHVITPEAGMNRIIKV